MPLVQLVTAALNVYKTYGGASKVLDSFEKIHENLLPLTILDFEKKPHGDAFSQNLASALIHAIKSTQDDAHEIDLNKIDKIKEEGLKIINPGKSWFFTSSTKPELQTEYHAFIDATNDFIKKYKKTDVTRSKLDSPIPDHFKTSAPSSPAVEIKSISQESALQIKIQTLETALKAKEVEIKNLNDKFNLIPSAQTIQKIYFYLKLERELNQTYEEFSKMFSKEDEENMLNLQVIYKKLSSIFSKLMNSDSEEKIEIPNNQLKTEFEKLYRELTYKKITLAINWTSIFLHAQNPSVKFYLAITKIFEQLESLDLKDIPRNISLHDLAIYQAGVENQVNQPQSALYQRARLTDYSI